MSSTGLIVGIVVASIAIAAGMDGLDRKSIRSAALAAPALAYGVNAVVARRGDPDDLARVRALSSVGLTSRSQFEMERYVAYTY